MPLKITFQVSSSNKISQTVEFYASSNSPTYLSLIKNLFFRTGSVQERREAIEEFLDVVKQLPLIIIQYFSKTVEFKLN